MSSFVHIDDKNKDILILGEGLDHIILTAKAKYPINFTQSRKDLHEVYTVMQATVC